MREAQKVRGHGQPRNCKLGVSELTFFGLRLSSDGIDMGEDKIKALREAGTPKDSSELRSLLGLAVYCSSHIPNLATNADPLGELVKEGVTLWSKRHERKA